MQLLTLWISFAPFFRPDTLDPALLRPGRLDRKVEFGLPDMESRTQIFKIHTRTMNCERDIRFELLARLCPNSTGKNPLRWWGVNFVLPPSLMFSHSLQWSFCMLFAHYAIGVLTWVSLSGADIRSVCTEAGMYAIRARRKTVTEKDFLDAVNKVIKGYQKFSATPKYMVYNWVSCFASFLKKNHESSYRPFEVRMLRAILILWRLGR